MCSIVAIATIRRTILSPTVSPRASPVTVPVSFDRLAMLDAIYQSATDLDAILAPDGALLDANPSTLAFARMTLREAIGIPLWNCVGFRQQPELAASLESAVNAARDNGIAAFTSDALPQDGSPRILRFVVQSLSGPDTNQKLLRVSATDVTERTMAMEQLEERERRLRMLTDNMHNLLFLMRVEAPDVYRCESVNQAYLKVTGLQEHDVVGRLVHEVVSPAEAALVLERYAMALRGDGVITYREEAVMPAGRLVVETTLTAIRDAQGQATHLLGLARDVTDREVTLDALRESEARFRAAIDAGRDLFVIARTVRDAVGAIADFVIVDVNERATRELGVSHDDALGQFLLDVFPASRGTGLWEQCCRVVATGQPFEMVQSAPVPDSLGRWVQRQIVPLGDGVAIWSRDVTKRRREQEALEASEARHRHLFESSGAIQMIVDATTGAILDANPAAEVFYGWPRNAMLSMRITDLNRLTLDDWRNAAALNDDAPAQRATQTHRVATGEARDVEVAESAVFVDGRAARHLIVHDISDRVRAEVLLRESEARFRAVITGMSEGVVVHDADGAIRVVNPSAERILGLSHAELTGLTPIVHDWQAIREDGTPWPPAEHPAMVALHSGRSQPRTLMGIRRGDNESTWLYVTADPVMRPGEQRPYAAVAVFSDHTVQRHTEERLRQAQKLEAVGQLAGGLAHDFNNLLTVIRGATGFLLESMDADSPLVSDVRAIERASERAEELTRRLLAVGRRQLLRAEPVDLTALVQEQFATIRNEMPRAIRVQLTLDTASVVARLDRRQLLDAVRALVDNARAAMPDGGTLTIGTSVRVVERAAATTEFGGSPQYAVLEITDTGEGMSDEVRAHLFEPFFSTQPFGANRGIGLASVHGMVAQSHGFIECDSTLGQGTALRLFFPASMEAERLQAPSTSVRAIATRGVLMVDDDAMLRDLGRRMLERLGHSVAMAASGSEALALLERSAQDVSVLVTDLTMPGMSGIELISLVEQRFPQLPIVAISGFSMNASVRQELDARHVPFVGKPFTSEQLTRAIERALEAKGGDAIT